MYSDFAYSVQMQIVLAIITFTESFCSMYMLSNILLAALGLMASKKQKMLYAFITGTLLQSALPYALYFLGGCVSLDPALLLFLLTPNPVLGVLFYIAAERIFRFTPARFAKLAGYVFLCWIAVKTINRISGSLFFVQDETSYNYMKDAIQQVIYFIIFTGIYQLVMSSIRKGHISLSFVNKLFFNKRREYILFYFGSTFVFAVRFFLPLLITDQVIAYCLSLVIILLFIAINICWEFITNHRQTIANHELHISALLKGLDDLRGIKHDFNNILHTYSGYLEMKEYENLGRYHASLVSALSHAGNEGDLARRMQENPAIVTLLMQKAEYAEKKKVRLTLSLQCKVDDFYIDNMDLSRVLSCLLDNAIEAASESEPRRVDITVKPKTVNSKLIIITNSMSSMVALGLVQQSGISTKQGHEGMGLAIVHHIIGKYGNAVFHMECYSDEFSAYLELKERV